MAGSQIIRQADVCAADPDSRTRLLQSLPSHHDRHRRFGDKIVGEGTQEYTFERAATTGTDDTEGGFEFINLDNNNVSFALPLTVEI